MFGSAINRSIMISTISRAPLARDHEPRTDLAQLDAVGDVQHAVQYAEAGIGNVVDSGAGADADAIGHPAGGGRLEAFPTYAGINEDVDV